MTSSKELSVRDKIKERAKGTKWARSLQKTDVHTFLDQNVLGDFDWHDWFEKKPTNRIRKIHKDAWGRKRKDQGLNNLTSNIFQSKDGDNCLGIIMLCLPPTKPNKEAKKQVIKLDNNLTNK